MIYTDGACSGNPGPGGWAALVKIGDDCHEISGYEQSTTNNRMELTAVIRALSLDFLFEKAESASIYSDSKYLLDGIQSWMPKWKKNNWMTSNKEKVKNLDLWHALDAVVRGRQISWNWVPGHSGDKYNEIVDKIARNAITNAK